MYKCDYCGIVFDEPAHIEERHGFSTPPYEKIAVCPVCGMDDFSECEESEDEE